MQGRKKDEINNGNIPILEYVKGDEKFLNIKISVIDTGLGISEEGLKKLFIDFGKLDENSTRNRKGTGLGLSICKQIVEQMGGSVDVKSQLGKGTEFIVNIKAKCKVETVEFSEFAPIGSSLIHSN
jgi:signal transduction histidine kinase